jgi:hypothetical protein
MPPHPRPRVRECPWLLPRARHQSVSLSSLPYEFLGGDLRLPDQREAVSAVGAPIDRPAT